MDKIEYERLSEIALIFSKRYAKDYNDACDIAQSVILIFLSKTSKVTNIRSWIYTVVKIEAIKHYKK